MNTVDWKSVFVNGDLHSDPYPKPGCGQENNEGGGWDYYRYSFNTGINKNVMNNYIL